MIRAADCKPSQTRTQRSGPRLKACQKHFFDTLKIAVGFACGGFWGVGAFEYAEGFCKRGSGDAKLFNSK